MGLQKYRVDEVWEAYPNGSIPAYTRWMGGHTLALIRNCPCSKGGVSLGARTVYTRGEADTYFSIPAACRVKGRTVKGFVMHSDSDGWTFHAYTDD